MAICTKLENGYLLQDSQNPDPLNCPGWVIPSGDEFKTYFIAPPFEPTPEAIMQVFTWGMSAVLIVWGVGFAISVAKKLISKV